MKLRRHWSKMKTENNFTLKHYHRLRESGAIVDELATVDDVDVLGSVIDHAFKPLGYYVAKTIDAKKNQDIPNVSHQKRQSSTIGVWYQACHTHTEAMKTTVN